MISRQTARGMEITAEDFHLEQTLDCGQCFRWDRQEDGSYCGEAFGKRLLLTQDENTVVFHGVSPEDFQQIWSPYFDLDTAYGGIKGQLSALHPVLREACAFAPGIRILRQDPWEALCSFIISQNNNIPRIKGIISRLCSGFGTDSRFPSPESLAPLETEDLAPLRSGFRAKYILSAARMVSSGEVDFSAVSSLPLDEARDILMKIKGVGKKVADCALLYGFHRLDAFPMDVWMRRAMDVLFPGVMPEDFGEYAGVAQQYIFHYSRCHPALFKEKAG